jgi:hypothetical protein
MKNRRRNRSDIENRDVKNRDVKNRGVKKSIEVTQ